MDPGWHEAGRATRQWLGPRDGVTAKRYHAPDDESNDSLGAKRRCLEPSWEPSGATFSDSLDATDPSQEPQTNPDWLFDCEILLPIQGVHDDISSLFAGTETEVVSPNSDFSPYYKAAGEGTTEASPSETCQYKESDVLSTTPATTESNIAVPGGITTGKSPELGLPRCHPHHVLIMDLLGDCGGQKSNLDPTTEVADSPHYDTCFGVVRHISP